MHTVQNTTWTTGDASKSFKGSLGSTAAVTNRTENLYKNR